MKLIAVLSAAALIGGASTFALAQTGASTNTTTNTTTSTSTTDTNTTSTNATSTNTTSTGTTSTNTTATNSTSANFGGQVSVLAHDKDRGAHHGLGAVVSAMARAMHVGSTNTTDADAADTNSTDTADASDATETPAATAHSSLGHGKGNLASSDAGAVAAAKGAGRSAVASLRTDVRSSAAQVHGQVADVRSNAASMHAQVSATVQQAQDVRATVAAVRHGH